MTTHAVFCVALVASFAVSGPALAQSPWDVGLGIAGGFDYSAADTTLVGDSSTSFAWGFFVDIPLADTFHISPQTTLYELDLRQDDGQAATTSVTDVGLNFKFVVPLRSLSLSFGILAGATTGLGDYRPHYGTMAQLDIDLIGNIGAFILGQYKRVNVDDQFGEDDIAKIHGFTGVMFRF